jgi:hypothetical protein
MPENEGFTVDFDSISGDLNGTGFDMAGGRYKNGRIEIDVETVSGSLDIMKN